MSRPSWITPPPEEVLELFVAARRTDPATSHAAAAEAGDLAEEHRERILAALAVGSAGASRIGERCRLSSHQVNKRLPELLRAGLVELTGRTVTSASGRGEREWRVYGR